MGTRYWYLAVGVVSGCIFGCSDAGRDTVNEGLPATQDVGGLDLLDVHLDISSAVPDANALDALTLYGSAFSEVTDFDAIGAEAEPSDKWPSSTYFTMHHTAKSNEGTCRDATYFGGPHRLDRCNCDLGADDDQDGESEFPFCQADYDGYLEDMKSSVRFHFGLNDSWYDGPGVYYTAYESCSSSPQDHEFKAGGLPAGAIFAKNERMVQPDVYLPEEVGSCGSDLTLGYCEKVRHEWRCLLTVKTATMAWFEADYACEDKYTATNGEFEITSRVETFEGSFGFVPSTCKAGFP